MANTNLQRELIAMGPQNALDSLGIRLEDYVTMAYDNDIIEYVSAHIPELTDLRKHIIHPTYDYNGRGPLRGLVFQYVGKHKTNRGNIILPQLLVPKAKLRYLIDEEKLLTEEMLIEFINEFYDFDATKIIPLRETNFG